MARSSVENVIEKIGIRRSRTIRREIVLKRKSPTSPKVENVMERSRVIFELNQDDDGYPPFSHEGIWAIRIADDVWRVDNIPFFSSEVSNCDSISVSRGVNDALLFKSVVSRGGHSTIRIFFNEDSKIPEIRASLRNLGCSSEGTNIKRLVAVDVPPDVDMRRVEGYLNELKDNDLIDVEHGLIQHSG